jgi:hypothetical protein
MSERRFQRGGGGGGFRRSGGGGRGGPQRGGGGGGGGGGRGGEKLASVGARFTNVGSVRIFFEKLGMPDSLVRQLGDWLNELQPDEAERMEPELTWEGRPARLDVTAVVDEEDGGVDVEFGGPASLIEALQADLDEFFRPKQPRKK